MSPPARNDRDLLVGMEGLALSAGRLALDIYSRDFAVEAKGDHSPVTEADRQGEVLIVDGL